MVATGFEGEGIKRHGELMACSVPAVRDFIVEHHTTTVSALLAQWADFVARQKAKAPPGALAVGNSVPSLMLQAPLT